MSKLITKLKERIKIRTFFKNLKYLFRYDLRSFEDARVQTHSLKYAIHHLKYELNQDLKLYHCDIKQKNNEETLNYLLQSKVSMVRYGDGEIRLMQGLDMNFQKASPILAQRLKEVLLDNCSGLICGLPDLYPYFDGYNIEAITYVRSFYGQYRSYLLSFLDRSRTYYNANISLAYMNNFDLNRPNLDDYYKKFSTLWDGKDIAIICGERTFNQIEYNIFDSASNIEYVWAPSTDAFDHYDEILSQAKKISKEKLVLIILGPTATVLGYDLFKLGYRAIDIGHLAKDFDAYKKQLKVGDRRHTCFFAND